VRLLLVWLAAVPFIPVVIPLLVGCNPGSKKQRIFLKRILPNPRSTRNQKTSHPLSMAKRRAMINLIKAIAAEKVVRKHNPNFEIQPKADSRVHKTIGKLLRVLGNPDYLEQYWTTLGNTASYPTNLSDGFAEDSWQTVLHEGWHSIQNQKYTKYLTSAAYLVPQIFGILAVLLNLIAAVTGFWSPWLLVGLVFLAPIPAPFRALIEWPAYKISIATDFWTWGDIEPKKYKSYVDKYVVEAFAGPGYYWMWPFRSWVRSAVIQHIEDLRANRVKMTPYLQDCKDLCFKFKGKSNKA
jgi:hypothetical protein